tara:strand:- start:178984 stop:179172 length:189 start_codon:yes stop_codon:yes gene_type:complete
MKLKELLDLCADYDLDTEIKIQSAETGVDTELFTVCECYEAKVLTSLLFIHTPNGQKYRDMA